MQEAIERAITIMWERYDEPLSLDDLAGSAYLSRFYFSRLFRSITGTSPGRFLAAIRLYQAKIMLRETDMSVTDIAYGVGYNSLGTFISRFTRSVGISPARYRALAEYGIPQPFPGDMDCGQAGGVVRGRLDLPPLGDGVRVYVGLFYTPIVQGLPLSCDILDAENEYELSDVPAGEWYLRAAAISTDPAIHPTEKRPLAVGASDTIEVRSGATETVDLTMHPTGVFDLPILVALPELDSLAADRARQRRRMRRPARVAV